MLEGIKGFFGGGNKEVQEQPQILDSHDQVDPRVELEAINKRIAELVSGEDTNDSREELRVLNEKKVNLEDTIAKMG